MSRIHTRLNSLRGSRRKALVAFITGGDPNKATTAPAMRALVAGGADVIEVGMPFSDPEAEGPAVQKSSERALAAGTRLADILDVVTEFRAQDTATPVLLMGYLNSIERMGYREFVNRAATAGVDGMILVNLPPEEAGELRDLMRARGLELIFLIAPTTTPERIRLIAGHAGGFIYYVALKGVTGATHLRTDGIAEQIARIRSHTDLPIMIGFGIKDGTTARMVAPLADGVVVGSSLVTTMERLEHEPERIAPALLEQVREIRTAIDKAMTVRTLDDWLAHAERVHPVGIDMGLARVRRVAESLGVLPPAAHNIVVAGTNGKGSTSVYLEALLLADGRSVGTTLSPHLSRFNERVRVNGQAVDDATLCDAFATIEDARGETTLTYFEFGVLVALLVFRRARVDATVLEVGLGGRLDAVNIVDGCVSVITSIGIDHVGYLGPDRESIGREKAGILRRGVPCVYGEASIPASIVSAAQALQAPVTRFGAGFFRGGRRTQLELRRMFRFGAGSVHRACAAFGRGLQRRHGVASATAGRDHVAD